MDKINQFQTCLAYCALYSCVTINPYTIFMLMSVNHKSNFTTPLPKPIPGSSVP